MGLILIFVLCHTEGLLDVAAVDLDDPPTFFRERHILRRRPIKPAQESPLLAKEEDEAFFQGLISRAVRVRLPHAPFLKDRAEGGISLNANDRDERKPTHYRRGRSPVT